MDERIAIEQRAARDEHHDDQNEIRGHDSTDPSMIKAGQPEGPCVQIRKNSPGDQKPRKQEEHVHPGEAPRARYGQEVEEYDGNHREGTDAIEMAQIPVMHTQRRSGARPVKTTHPHEPAIYPRIGRIQPLRRICR